MFWGCRGRVGSRRRGGASRRIPIKRGAHAGRDFFDRKRKMEGGGGIGGEGEGEQITARVSIVLEVFLIQRSCLISVPEFWRIA